MFAHKIKAKQIHNFRISEKLLKLKLDELRYDTNNLFIGSNI